MSDQQGGDAPDESGHDDLERRPNPDWTSTFKKNEDREPSTSETSKTHGRFRRWWTIGRSKSYVRRG